MYRLQLVYLISLFIPSNGFADENRSCSSQTDDLKSNNYKCSCKKNPIVIKETIEPEGDTNINTDANITVCSQRFTAMAWINMDDPVSIYIDTYWPYYCSFNICASEFT